jgi:hypothetical protein
MTDAEDRGPLKERTGSAGVFAGMVSTLLIGPARTPALPVAARGTDHTLARCQLWDNPFGLLPNKRAGSMLSVL